MKNLHVSWSRLPPWQSGFKESKGNLSFQCQSEPVLPPLLSATRATNAVIANTTSLVRIPHRATSNKRALLSIPHISLAFFTDCHRDPPIARPIGHNTKRTHDHHHLWWAKTFQNNRKSTVRARSTPDKVPFRYPCFSMAMSFPTYQLTHY